MTEISGKIQIPTKPRKAGKGKGKPKKRPKIKQHSNG